MSGRNEKDLEGISLLGNQGTKYILIIHQKFLKYLRINILIVIILSSLIVLSLRVFVRSQDNLTLPRFILVIFPISKWLKVNH